MSVAARSCGLGRCRACTRDLSISLFGHISSGCASRFLCTNRTLECKVISPIRAVSLPLISVRSRSHIRAFAGSRARSHKDGANGMGAHLITPPRVGLNHSKAADDGAKKWKGRDSAPAMSGTRTARPTCHVGNCHVIWRHGDQFYVIVMALIKKQIFLLGFRLNSRLSGPILADYGQL